MQVEALGVTAPLGVLPTAGVPVSVVLAQPEFEVVGVGAAREPEGKALTLAQVLPVCKGVTDCEALVEPVGVALPQWVPLAEGLGLALVKGVSVGEAVAQLLRLPLPLALSVPVGLLLRLSVGHGEGEAERLWLPLGAPLGRALALTQAEVVPDREGLPEGQNEGVGEA
jgi:hypothetical protein